MQRSLKALEFDKVLEKFSAYCVSLSAKQKALQIIPYLSPYDTEINSLFHNRELFTQARDWLTSSQYALSPFPELEGILNYLEGSHPFLDAESLWAVKEILNQLKNVIDSIDEGANLRPALTIFVQSKEFPQEIHENLTRCIGDLGVIKDNASPALFLLRNELRGLNQNCLKKVKEAVNEYNMMHYLQDDYITLDSDRYVLPLKSNFKGRLQGIIHHYSNTGETVFFEPLFLVEINNRIQELKKEEREEENKILLMLTKLLVNNKEGIKDTWNLLLDIDILLAKVALASAYDGHCLIMQENVELHLSDAKHPLLALEANTNKNLKLRPLDISLRELQRVLIISGGNAGGKTVCLKTAGLIILMTLAGLPVPVDHGSTLPIIQQVHAFIGDEQSLDEHVSTFTGQIKHLAKAWEVLNQHSLVLLDEFGAGTDPTQGAALAQAVIDGILEKQAFALAATHFPALKTYALSHEHVRAASVLFEEKTKKPLYTLAYDQVGASIALQVACEHGLPESIIKQAEHYLLVDNQDSEKIINTLNALAVEREKELAHLKNEQKKEQEKRKEVQAKFEAERLKLHNEVRQLSSELMASWKEGKSTAKQALKEMAKLKASLVAVVESEPKKELSKEEIKNLLETIKIKDYILYNPWDKQALVLEVDVKSKKVKIDLNGVSLWAAVSDISLVTSQSGQNKIISKKVQSQEPRASEEMVRRKLDIRGKRADVALSELESFLDKALLNSVDIVEIVHGKGTGALRKSVHEFLRTSPFVSHHELANEDCGGDGVTLTYIR